MLKTGIEGIDFQINSKFGPALELLFAPLRSISTLKKSDLPIAELQKLIKDETGLNVTVHLERVFNAWVYIPTLSANNIIINDDVKGWLNNDDAVKAFKTEKTLKGGVSLKTGRVFGCFNKIPINIHLGDELLHKGSRISVAGAVSILLHEIGHVMVYLEMLSRLTRTNYILAEGTKALMGAANKEIRLELLNHLEEKTGTKIEDKAMLANQKPNESVYQTVIITSAVAESVRELDINIYEMRAFEQLADQYATRMGYGRHLAIALDTLYRLDVDRAYIHPAFNTLINIIQFLRFISITIGAPPIAILFLLLVGNPLKDIYDDPKMRINKIKEQLITALKDSSLSPEQRRVFQQDHEKVLEMLEKMHRNDTTYKVIWKFMPWGRKQARLITMQEEMESLFNNDLHAHI